MINAIELFVQKKLNNDVSGHDWDHINRVRNLALQIALIEEADSFICECAALLHDVIDDKIIENVDKALNEVETLLTNLGVDYTDREHIISIITNMSFSAQINQKVELTLEGKIVQDADRLDAIGAIGIIRTIAYGTTKNHRLFDPTIEPLHYESKIDYRNAKSTTINHFYEKLLLLKNQMNTKFAKEMAVERHQFMELFLEQFFNEWHAKK